MPNELERISIFGIRIDNLTRDETEDWIKSVLNSPPEQKFVATLNPEIVLKGYRDENYRDILNGSDLNLCDGFGVKLVAVFKGRKIKSRYTGVELTDFLLKLAKEKNKKVLVVVSGKSLSVPEEIERKIEDRYGLKAQVKHFDEKNFFNTDAANNAQIVFVNFGAPHQEKFIYERRGKFPEARILVGVGGAFDFLTGKMKRAPGWMRKIGLEWLFRLVQEPKRLKRIWRAVVVFPILVFIKSK
jgi:N-acetylglucosaminyldiphosphoundecaprenol N-acetyl-beta-D-mannosaminyltransferase